MMGDWCAVQTGHSRARIYRRRFGGPQPMALKLDMLAVYERFAPLGLTIPRLARDFGVSPGMMRNWLHAARRVEV